MASRALCVVHTYSGVHACIYARNIGSRSLKQKLGAVSPFSCQAKRDIKYFRSRARDGTGAESRERSREAIPAEKEGARKGGRKRRTKRWRTVPLARTENRKTITGEPEGPRLRRFPTTPSRLFFSPSITLSVSFPRFPLAPRHHPRHCARPARRAVSPASLCSGVLSPQPLFLHPRLKSAFEIPKPAAVPVTRTVNALPAENPATPFPPARYPFRAPADGAGHSDLRARRRASQIAAPYPIKHRTSRRQNVSEKKESAKRYKFFFIAPHARPVKSINAER